MCATLSTDEPTEAEVAEKIGQMTLMDEGAYFDDKQELIDKAVEEATYKGSDIKEIRAEVFKRGRILNKTVEQIIDDISCVIVVFLNRKMPLRKFSQGNQLKSGIRRIDDILESYKINKRLINNRNCAEDNLLTVARILSSFPVLGMKLNIPLRLSPIESPHMAVIKCITCCFFSCFLDVEENCVIDLELMHNISFIHLACQIYNTWNFSGQKLERHEVFARQQWTKITNSAKSGIVSKGDKIEYLTKMQMIESYKREDGSAIYVPTRSLELMAQLFWNKSKDFTCCSSERLFRVLTQNGGAYSDYKGMYGYRRYRGIIDEDYEEPDKDNYQQSSSSSNEPGKSNIQGCENNVGIEHRSDLEELTHQLQRNREAISAYESQRVLEQGNSQRGRQRHRRMDR